MLQLSSPSAQGHWWLPLRRPNSGALPCSESGLLQPLATPSTMTPLPCRPPPLPQTTNRRRPPQQHLRWLPPPAGVDPLPRILLSLISWCPDVCLDVPRCVILMIFMVCEFVRWMQLQRAIEWNIFCFFSLVIYSIDGSHCATRYRWDTYDGLQCHQSMGSTSPLTSNNLQPARGVLY